MPADTHLNPPDRLAGGGVVLRRSVPADAPALFAAAHDPLVMRYMDWPAQIAQGEAWAFLDAAGQRWRDGSEFHWMVEREGDAGAVGCMACRPKAATVELGFFLQHAAWGHGHATAAVVLLVGWLKARSRVWRIAASVDADNARAAAVLERAGLRREGLLRAATVRPNIGPQPRDTWVYGLGRGDF
jgi:[ribosomal protein S5]-alanine N-acetyltransferase